MIGQLRKLQVPVTMLYGVTYEEDLIYMDVLEKLMQEAHFDLKVRVSDTKRSDIQYAQGRVLDDLNKMAFTLRDTVYLCGNPYMIHDARQWINKRFETNIKMERFG